MNDISLYNTLSNRRELFAPRDEKRVTMYVCGPTVYGPVHVGNARPAAVFDVLFRLLRRRYGEDAVLYARNITDIDDKIIAAAAEAGETPAALAARWQNAYHEQMRRLHTLPPTAEPRAVSFIPQMILMIETLLQKGFAYTAENHVLFHAPSFSDYGALSNRRMADMRAGARVEVAPYKKDAADFVLWKPAADDAPGWESPWGRGRPGWHIECSAMAAACLGEEIDLHGGGQDLIFPHHENEIAQSRCAGGCESFAKFWVHNGHVTTDGGKMSKSRGNALPLSGALARFPGEAARYALLAAHYRSPLHWGAQILEEAKSALDRLYRALGDAPPPVSPGDENEIAAALSDDLNTPRAFALLHEFARDVNKGGDARAKLFASGRLLGFFNVSAARWFHSASADSISDDEVASLIKERRRARKNRDFAAADAVRDKLAAQGIALEDSAEGTTWRRI
ncbi:MAG: cysteine--tRNA ligase [Gammaproteobacteria bacterium]